MTDSRQREIEPARAASGLSVLNEANAALQRTILKLTPVIYAHLTALFTIERAICGTVEDGHEYFSMLNGPLSNIGCKCQFRETLSPIGC